MSMPRRLALKVLPLRVRKWLRDRLFATSQEPMELAYYHATSSRGADSDNIWIRRSAEIGGWLFEGEHEFLWELATRRLSGDIVEIGTWMGKSACILAGACAESAPETKVVCIDTFRMSGTDSQEAYHHRLLPKEPGTFYQFLSNADRLGFASFVVPIAAYSTRALPLLRGPFRLAFVDGAHDRENCGRDIELCLTLLALGGVLAVHDATGGHWPGVEEYVNEVLNVSPMLKHVGTRGTVVAFEKIAPTTNGSN